MCSRYWFDEGVYEDLEEMNIGLKSGYQVKRHDVHPADPAFVISRNSNEEGHLLATEEKWGFPTFDKKLVINARAEDIFDRKMFRNGIQHQRIIVPAAGFYEWNASKEKSSFKRTDGTLYMAGIAEIAEDENRFVIITTAANDSMRKVHDRMPLILEKDQLSDWILDDRRTKELLGQVPVNLERYTEYEQMSLF